MRLEEREADVHQQGSTRTRTVDADGPVRAEPARSDLLRGVIARGRSPAGRRSRIVTNVVTLLVTAAFVYFALSGVHLGRAWKAMSTSDYVWLLPALVALGFSMLARALRWQVLFAPGRRPRLGTVFNAMMVGYLFNNILPARAGEVARVVVLNNRSSAEPVEIVGTVVLERILDIIGILLIFFVAEPWLPSVSWFRGAAIAAAVLALLIATMAVALAAYGERGLRVVLQPLHRLPFISSERLDRTAEELTYGLSALRHPGVALLGLFWTLVAWLLTAVLCYFVGLAFYPHLPFAAGVLVAVAIGLAMILPSPPAAVGVFEGAALIGLKPYGFSHTQALPYALILHVVNFLPFIVVGVALLQYNARHARGRSTASAEDLAAQQAVPPDVAPPGAQPPAVNWGARPLAGSWGELPAAQQSAPVQYQARNGPQGLDAVDDRSAGADGRRVV
jgi:uncharacterized protein (TIRG00374 family)